MNGLALATKGWIVGIDPLELILFWDDSLTVKDHGIFEMIVGINKVVGTITIISLSSDDTGVVTLPSSVQIPVGDLTATFTSTTINPGTCQLSATLDSVTLYSSILVVGVSGLKPILTEAKDLKPTVEGAISLKPKVVSGENTASVGLKPTATSAKDLKPTVEGALSLRPKPIFGEEI
jgi:hypothetical protein